MPTQYKQTKVLKHTGLLLIGVMVVCLQSTEAAPMGDFDSQADIGDPAKSGGADYHAERQEYQLRGAGKNMWFDRDEFHFVWKQLEGDFILTARAEFVGTGANAHRKLGWMVR